MNIGSGAGYPAGALSNFTPRTFVFDGVICNSIEGLLQALKSPYVPVQQEICKLVGRMAKKRGSKIDWKRTQTLHWNGVDYPRDSKNYQLLLDRIFNEVASQNEAFKNALLASQNATLTHTIGKSDPKETILTVREFCSRLTAIRTQLQNEANSIFK